MDLLREYIRELMSEAKSDRGGMDIQVAMALIAINNGTANSAVTAAPKTSYPDVEFDNGIRIEAKSSKVKGKGSMDVSPYDLTCADATSCPTGREFKPLIDAVINTSVRKGSLVDDQGNQISDVGLAKKYLLSTIGSKSKDVEMADYVKLIGGFYTRKAPPGAPRMPFVYRIRTKNSLEEKSTGNVVSLETYNGLKGFASNVGKDISFSHRLVSSPSAGSNGWDNPTGDPVYADLGGVVYKQETMDMSTTPTSSSSKFRPAGGSSFPTAPQSALFGSSTFSDPAVREAAANMWKKHLKEDGDRYIAIGDKAQKKIYVLGVADDPLGFGTSTLSADAVIHAIFGNYGAAGVGTMRIKTGLKLDSKVFTALNYPPPVDFVKIGRSKVSDTKGRVLMKWDGQNDFWGTQEEFDQAVQDYRLAPGGPMDPSHGGYPTPMADGLIRKMVRERLLMEELTGSDKSEIARIVRKEIDKDRAKQKKIARDEASAEIKDALGVSFFGVKGKINKFVVDAIRDEVSKMVNKGQTRDDIAQITKNVIKKLYKELAIAQAPVIDRIKV